MQPQNKIKKTSNTFSGFFVVCILVVSSGFAAHTFYTNQKYHKLSRASKLSQTSEVFEYQNSTKLVQSKMAKNESARQTVSQNETVNTGAAFYVSQGQKLLSKKSKSEKLVLERKAASVKNDKTSMALPELADSKTSVAENILNSIKTKADAQEFLKSVQLTNPNEIRKAVPLQEMNQNIQAMAGPHSGELVWEHAPDHPVQLKVDFNPNLDSNISQGKMSIELSMAGVNIEDRTFKSTLASLPGTADIPDATILALGNRRYLQLYYAKNMEQWIGIYYMQNPITNNLQYVGTTSVKVSSALK